jgi:hypothetical protein
MFKAAVAWPFDRVDEPEMPPSIVKPIPPVAPLGVIVTVTFTLEFVFTVSGIEMLSEVAGFTVNDWVVDVLVA